MRNTRIETFRIRTHGDDTLRLLARGDTDSMLHLIREIEQGFYIGKDVDTAIGGYIAKLTVDYILAGTSREEMLAVTHVDLAKRDNSFKSRWELQTNTPPTIDNDRFVSEVRADFENTLPIGSTIVIDPEAPEVLPTFHRYIHSQPSPSVEWIINHNLGERPLIELFTVGGQEMEADIVHVTDNQARAYFAIPIAGSARCI